MFYFIYLLLFNSMNILIYQKMKANQIILTMLDTKLRLITKVNQDMPVINVYNDFNLMQIMQMFKVIQDMHRVQFQRGLRFVSALVILFKNFQIYLFLIPWAYVSFRIAITKSKVEDIGSPVFLIYTHFDFYLSLYYFIRMLVIGAEANLADTKLKQILMNISRECSLTSLYSRNEMVYKIKKYKTE